jgi:cysteine desulfuration protein SufE
MTECHAADTAAAQDAIIEEFNYFDDWMDRYQYLIDLGRKLEPLAAEEKIDENILHGCQSQVWLIVSGDADKLIFRANSDAAIVSGLIALLLRVFSGRSASDILATDPYFVREIGLDQHLSPTPRRRLNDYRAVAAAVVPSVPGHPG